MESIPGFDVLFDRKTTEEIGTLLDAFLEGGDEENTEVTQYKKSDESSSDESSSVDKAFNELLS
jgi:hypothetical protein